MTDTVIVNLPFFPGFYESTLSWILDSVEEQEAEDCAVKEASAAFYPETYQPEQLRLDSGDYSSVLFDAMDYASAHGQMASDYVAAFDQWASDNLSTPRDSFLFESMDSPREYNFTTDRVFATVPLSVMESLHKSIDAGELATIVSERHSSRSGFISFYSNNLEKWEAKPFEEWDHNEYGTLLCAAIAASGNVAEMAEYIESAIVDKDYTYVDQHCDWVKFDEKVKDARAEKLATWIRDDVAAARGYVDGKPDLSEIVALALAELDSDETAAWHAAAENAPYRCPETLEMFPQCGAA